MSETPKITATSKNKLKPGTCNLFFVSTALHLLNAIEAQHYFKTKNNILVLLCYGNNLSDETQLGQYLHHFPYDKLITFNIGKAKLYHRLNLSIINKVNQHSYEKVFLGYFSANLRRFACNIPCDQLFLLDDGTYLVALHDELYNPEFKASQHPKLIRSYSEKPRKNILKQLVFLAYNSYRRFYFTIHGCKNDFKQINLNFFTIFNIPQFRGETIINHSFEKLKKIYKQHDHSQKQHAQTVYFLGQPLDKALGFDSSQYIKFLKRVNYFYKQQGIKIIYIPHRSESTNTQIKTRQMQSSTFQILLLEKPFEIHLLEENINAGNIASFFSSALFTTKKLINGIKVDAFKLPFDPIKRSDIEVIYNTMKRENIRIHKLNISDLID